MKKIFVVLGMIVSLGLTGCSNSDPDELLSIDTSRIMTDQEGNMIILEDLNGNITKINKNDLNTFMAE